MDPNTLNEKQKKDTKFMETINTEFTPIVVAKALQSLIATLNVKARIVICFRFSKRKIIRKYLLAKRGSTMWCMHLNNSLKQRYRNNNIG